MVEQVDTPPIAFPEAVWSQVWHLPVLLLGVGLFLVGLWFTWSQQQNNDFTEVLRDVAYELAARELDTAESKLQAMQRHIDQASRFEQAEYWQYWADLNFLQIRQNKLVLVETVESQKTNEKIVEYYRKAENLGREIGNKSVSRLAQALVALGRDVEALQLVERFEPGAKRYEILRSLIERHWIDRQPKEFEALTALIKRFNQELGIEQNRTHRREQEIWITAQEAQLQMGAKDFQRAIDFLLQRLLRLSREGQGDDLAGLEVLLAQAYQQIGQWDHAGQRYQHAQQSIAPSNGLNARIFVGLGQLVLAGAGSQHVDQALEYFSAADDQFPADPVHIEALIGRADCEARLGEYLLAVGHFGEAVHALGSRSQPWDSRRQILAKVVRSHVDRNLDQQRFGIALELLTQLVPLYSEQMPSQLLFAFASTHEKIADQYHGHAQTLPDKIDREEMNQARRLAYKEAALHYNEAGHHYLLHAQSVTIMDDQAHGLSLWNAAVCYDQAQNWSKAIEVYAQFAKTRHTDVRQLEAVKRLGMAYLSDGQPEPAVEQFLVLLTEHAQNPVTTDSLVPLAKAYVALDKPDAAERTLLQIVADHEAIKPDSPQYRDALIELGMLYYRLGQTDGHRYIQAIERFEEAVHRYGRDDQGSMLRYYLADSYRKSVVLLEEQLTKRQAQRQRMAIQLERSRRLERAQTYFNQVVSMLDDKPVGELSELNKLYLRNAYFFQADSAFDRGQYEIAIELYDAAARRWDSDPASLVALIQIVNAHCELQQYQEAKVANHHARWQLERIPEQAFDDPTLPMSRQHWEDWLRWTSELNLFASQASVPNSSASLP